MDSSASTRRRSTSCYLVVSGTGWVRGEDDVRVDVEAGTAVFWRSGERHTSGSDSGMTVIVLEGEGLEPGAYLEAESGA